MADNAWSYASNVATYTDTTNHIKIEVNNVASEAGLGKPADGKIVVTSELAIATPSKDGDTITITTYTGVETTESSGEYTYPNADEPPKYSFENAASDGLVASTTSKEWWSVSSGTATYQKDTTAGYAIQSNNPQTIAFTAAKTDIAKITGVNSNATESNFTIDGTTITVDASALSESTGVTLSEGSATYFLELGGTLTDAQKAESKTWSVIETTATYALIKKPKFQLAENAKSITYSATGYGDGESTTLATLTGVKSNAAASSFSEAADNVITLKAGALDATDVSIGTGSGTYTLALATTGSDKVTVSTDGTKKFFAGVSSGNVVYGAAGTTGYNLTDNDTKVKYYDGSTLRTTLATFNNFKSSVNAAALNETGQKLVEAGTDKFTVHYAALEGVIDNVNFTSATYTLELDDDVYQPNDGDPAFNKASDTSATYQLGTHKNYTATASGINYSSTNITTGAPNIVYATISGLNLGSEAVSDWSNLVEVKEPETGKYTFTLKEAALTGTTNVSVAGGEDKTGTATTATLELDSDITSSETDNLVPEWIFNGTTAIYQRARKSTHYIENGVVKTVETPVYINADGTQATAANAYIEVLGTFTGIKNGAKDTDFDVSGTTITVKAGALDSKDVVFTPGKNGKGESYGYKVAIYTTAGGDGQVTEASVDTDNNKFFYDDDGNVKLRNVWSEGYKLKDADAEAGTPTTIKYYNGSTIGDDLATLTGINTGLSNEALNTALTETSDTITFKAAALGTSDVQLTNEAGNSTTYSFVLDADTEEEVKEWDVATSGTAKYNTTQKSHYSIGTGEDKGKILYSSELGYAKVGGVVDGKDNITTMVTFTGVKKDAKEGDFAVDDATKTITIKESAFDTEKGTKVSYTVATYTDGEEEVSYGYTVALAEGMDEKTTTHEWTLGTDEETNTDQAVYKEVKRQKFYLDTKNNKITYFDVEGDTSGEPHTDDGKNVIVKDLFKVSGYNSALTDAAYFKTEDPVETAATESETPATATDGETPATATITPAFTVDATTKKVTVAKSAAGGENIVLTKIKSDAGYTFAALGDDFAKPDADEAPTWSVGEVKDGSKKVLTATLSKSMHSDYILKEGDATKIIYTPHAPEERDAVTIATITGFNKKAKKTDFTLESDGEGGQIITLSANAIADATEITLTETEGLADNEFAEHDFKLALADDILTTPEDTWSFSGGKATYSRETPPTYTFTLGGKSSTIEDGGDTLKIDGKGGKTKSSVLAQISGLNKNIPAELLEEGYLFSVDTVGSDKVITISSYALGTGKVSLTNKGETYKLALDDEDEYLIKKGEGTETWVVSGTTAKFYDKASEAIDTSDDKKWGYELTGDTITYTAPTIKKGAEPSITINGLVSGLVPDGTGEIEGIRVTGTTVYISHDLFNKKNITISGNYKLAFDDVAPEEVTTDPATAEGAVTTDPAEVEGAVTTDPAEVEGAVTEKPAEVTEPDEDASGEDKRAYATYLKEKAAFDAYEVAKTKYDAYEVAKTKYDEYVIAKAAYDEYQAYLKLKLEETDTAKIDTKYDDKKGTFTVNQTLTKDAYTLSANGKAIFYSKNGGATEIAKLTNLAATKDNISAAVEFDPTTGVITLKEAALGDKKIALTGDAGYELALEISEDEQAIQKTEPEWGFNKTTATFKLVTPAGYHLADDKKSVTKDKETAEIYATLSGINAGLYDKLAKEVHDEVATKYADELTAIGNKLTTENDAKTEGKLGDEALAAAIAAAKEEFIAANNGDAIQEALKDYITVTAVDANNDGVTDKDSDGKEIYNITVLDPAALSAGNVSLAKGKNAEVTYKLVFSDDIPTKAGNAAEMWSFSNGTATLQTMKQGFYTLDGDKNTAKYTKPEFTDKDGGKTTPTLQISGLATNLLVEDGEIAGIDVAPEADADGKKTITLSSDALNKKNIKLAKGDGYELALDSADDETKISYAWDSKNGKVTLNEQKSEGYELSADGKSLTYIKNGAKPKAMATITGLNSPGTPTATAGTGTTNTLAGFSFDSAKGVVTITNANLLQEKAKISGSGGYTLEIGETATSGVATFGDPEWYVDAKKKALVYRKEVETNGLAISDDGKSIVKLEAGTAEAPKYANLITISGVNFGDLDFKNEGAVQEYQDTLNSDKDSPLSVDEGEGVVTLSAEMLGSAKITGKGVYKLDIAEGIAQSAVSDKAWIIKGSNATYQAAELPYYTVDSAKNTISYTAAKATKDSKPLITLKNIASGLVAKTDGMLDEITFDSKKVILHKGALGTKNATFEGSTDYTSVALANDVPQEGESAVTKAVKDPVWTFKGTSATYTQEKVASYKVEGTTIQYSKPATAKLATISGLAKGVDEEEKVDPSDNTKKIAKEDSYKTAAIAEALTPVKGVITLPHEVLYNTNLVSKKDSKTKAVTYSDSTTNSATAIKLTQGKDLDGKPTEYKLAVDTTTDGDGNTTAKDAWSIKGTTATYTSSVPDHYEADDEKTKVTFKAATPVENPTYRIVLTGIKKTTDTSKFTIGDGTSDAKKIVTVDDDVLADISKELKIEGTGKYADYKLAFDSTSTATDHYNASAQTGSWSSGTLKKTQKKGYTLSNDGKSISYLKADKQITVATVKGATSISGGTTAGAVDITISEKTSKAVTVDGVGYTFKFTNDYKGEITGEGEKAKLVTKAINGGKNADNIEVAGTGLVIKGAGGDDSITLTGTSTSTKDLYNTIVYNPGDGNDTITGLGQYDQIQIATAGATAVGKKSGSDYVITVTKGKNEGTITVVGKTSGINVVDKKGETYSGYSGGAAASVDKLLYSDNYALGAELGEIMSGNNVNGFSVGEVETGNATDLTKNVTPIVTASDKK